MQWKPAVAAVIESIRAAGRAAAAYALVVATRETQDVINFAKLNKNAAYFKVVEHCAKLSGLLIDKIEVVTVDLKGALEEARSRVVDVRTITPGQKLALASVTTVLVPANITANGERKWQPFSEGAMH
jgi:hypothetical protein